MIWYLLYLEEVSHECLCASVVKWWGVVVYLKCNGRRSEESSSDSSETVVLY